MARAITLSRGTTLSNFTFDQAEGLRRLIARPAPRLMTLLSADGHLERTVLLANIAATLVEMGSKVTVLDTCNTPAKLDARLGLSRNGQADLALVDVAQQRCRINDILHTSRYGFDFASINRQVVKAPIARQDEVLNEKLNKALLQLAQNRDILLSGAELDAYGELPLAALDDGEIMIQVSPTCKSITNGYGLIKRLVGRAGRRPFGIIVTGASEVTAQTIFNNLSQVASRYLAISLNACGSLPSDESLGRASQLGRSVIDAFPLAKTSVALRRMANVLSNPVHAHGR